jgi:hydroxypyruvate reductase
MTIRDDAQRIIAAALKAAQPDTAVKKALGKAHIGNGKLLLIAIGKASWTMARAASEILGNRINGGTVITKYGHSGGELPNVRVFEAGHPIPDSNSFAATEHAIASVSGLKEQDTVLFLVSGGGSALFEKPLISEEQLASVTRQMLGCGADITEINTIRKRLSAVKGGKFGELCKPARVVTVVLSDIIGDPLDMIASGPAYPDRSTAKDALMIVKKYNLDITEEIRSLLAAETPKKLDNVQTFVTGSVRELCRAAEKECAELGYKTTILTDSLRCTARDAGSFLASIAQYYNDSDRSAAFICGGETVVKLTGKGLGGRNQEIALSAAEGIGNLTNVAVFSVGSDGTDGPTDAAGGYCDNTTGASLKEAGIDISEALSDNDSYHALEKCGGLIMTGPTGTNVNDLSVLLIKR